MAVGLRRDGKKEVLGMWLGKNESAAFWMGVLTDMRARGVEDILITATNNLNGFMIQSVMFSHSQKIRFVWFIRSVIPADIWS
jgi:transposase-like protein